MILKRFNLLIIYIVFIEINSKKKSAIKVADSVKKYQAFFPQQFLYFFPEPQGQGSFRPIFGVDLTIVVLCACDCEETAVCAPRGTIEGAGELCVACILNCCAC